MRQTIINVDPTISRQAARNTVNDGQNASTLKILLIVTTKVDIYCVLSSDTHTVTNWTNFSQYNTKYGAIKKGYLSYPLHF